MEIGQFDRLFDGRDMNRFNKLHWPERLTLLMSAGWTLAVLASLLAEHRVYHQTTDSLLRFSSNNPPAQQFTHRYVEFLKSDSHIALAVHAGAWLAGLIGIWLAHRFIRSRIQAQETSARREQEAGVRLREQEQQLA